MFENELQLSNAQILLVDDHPDNLAVLSGVLEREGYRIMFAKDGVTALELAQKALPDLILLDVMMPGIDGFETCRQLKANPTTQDIPIIFLTARVDTSDVVQGFQVGGIDYIHKPFEDKELQIRVATQLRLRRLMSTLIEKNNALEAEMAQRQILTQERNQLTDHLSLISNEEAKRWGIDGFIGQSQTLQNILTNIERLQQASTISVLITGESGTGKELVARAIHYGSDRAKGPFVPVNCSAIPQDLADSLFFGHIKGAFTGADRDRSGYFELANGGTLFLDEMGDMPLDLQAKLLRALEDRKIMPVGAEKEKTVDVRVVAATNANLETHMQTGQFRQDLYFRLAGFPVQIPPLRERKEDIPLLAQHFLTLFANEMRLKSPNISSQALDMLSNHHFLGNIRELKNVIERALIESGGQDIQPNHLHLTSSTSHSPTQTTQKNLDDLPLNLEKAEIVLIKRALEQAGGSVTEAAKLLGTNRMKIYRKLAEAEALTDTK